MSLIKYGNRRVFLTSTFSGNETIKTVNLSDSIFDYYDTENKVYYYEDMCGAFANCINLETVSNINPHIINMESTFYGCSSLTNIDKLPLFGIWLNDTFNGCSSLTTTPSLPPLVQEIGGCFLGTGIEIAPIIPKSCLWMKKTFYNCSNLHGDVYIYSSNIESVEDCFTNTSAQQKNVYIPFKDENGDYTTTYNSFIEDGYDTFGTKDNTWLKDINGEYLLLTVNPTPSDATVTLT